MIAPEPRLIVILRLVERVPVSDPTPRGRGRPLVYSDRLVLKALVIMIVRHLHHVHELLAVVAEPTGEMEQVRSLLTEGGRFPCRRT
jgi:hypothetical protein